MDTPLTEVHPEANTGLDPIFLFKVLLSAPVLLYPTVSFSFTYISPYLHLLGVCSTYKNQRPKLCAIKLPKLCFQHSLIYPCQGASSAITAFVNYFRCRICSYLYRGPHRRRVLNRTISSIILTHTKPHISEYSCLSFNMSCDAIFQVA